MSVKNSIHAVPLASFNSASVSGMYQPIITGGLAKSCYVLRIINASTKDITISFDGSNDADYIVSATTAVLPEIYALIPNTNSAQFAQGTQIYLKGTAGTGTIYVAGYYQPQGA